MYKFIDVTDNPTSDPPAEAMIFDGIIFENQFPGYRTLAVSGREKIESEIKSDEIGLLNGTYYRGKRHKSRQIYVSFQLCAESDTMFREIFNILNGYLSRENVKVSFADEPDKYFICNSTGITDIPPGTNSVTGVITLICDDPYKYSTQIKHVVASDGLIEIDYMGTMPSPVKLTADISHDCGFVGYANDQGKALQFGNVTELDIETRQKPELLVNMDMTADNLKKCTVNGATLADRYGFSQSGTVSSVTRSVKDSGKNVTRYCAHMGSRGSSSMLWRGVGLKIPIPSDSSGKTSWKNGYAYFRHAMIASSEREQGITQLCVSDTQKRPLAAITFIKNSMTDKVNLELLVGLTKVKTDIQFNCNGLEALNVNLNFNAGHFSITKSGSKITFGMGINYTFDAKDYGYTDFADREIQSIDVFISSLTTQSNSYPSLAIQDLYSVKFQASDVPYEVDIHNQFMAGDLLEVDTGNAEVKVNGMTNYDIGTEGNQFEGFELHPGINKIHCVQSDFASNNVKFSADYQEVYA